MKRALLCVLLIATACLAQSTTSSTLIIHDVTVIDARGAPAKPHRTVIVRDGKIEAINSSGGALPTTRYS
jgi:hypothetical protein